MTASKLDPEIRAEIVRRLTAGDPVSRIAQEMHVGPWRVRAIRDEQRITPLRTGKSTLARPEPVRWDDLDEEDGDPRTANPQRIPVGLWCIERPNQRQWEALLDAAGPVELEALRLAMTWVLGLSLNATEYAIGRALTRERRAAEELAGLYLKARGYGR